MTLNSTLLRCYVHDILVLLRQFHKVMSVGTIVMHKSQEDNSVAKNALGRILQHDSLHHQKQH